MVPRDGNKFSSRASPEEGSSILWPDDEDNICEGRASCSITSFCSSCHLSFLLFFSFPFCHLCCHLTMEDVPLRDILNIEQSSSVLKKDSRKVCRLLSSSPPLLFSSSPPLSSPPPLQKFTNLKDKNTATFPSNVQATMWNPLARLIPVGCSCMVLSPFLFLFLICFEFFFKYCITFITPIYSIP